MGLERDCLRRSRGGGTGLPLAVPWGGNGIAFGVPAEGVALRKPKRTASARSVSTSFWMPHSSLNTRLDSVRCIQKKTSPGAGFSALA